MMRRPLDPVAQGEVTLIDGHGGSFTFQNGGSFTFQNEPDGMISKAQLRKHCIERRYSLGAKEENAAEQVKGNVLELLEGQKSSLVAGYVALTHELDLVPTLTALEANGIALCLPVCSSVPKALNFRSWMTDAPLESGPFGTVHPDASAEDVQPDVLLVPLVAFDGAGHRLGYGKGYYDRTLRALRSTKNIVAYGVAYDGQEIEAVPYDHHDALLDGIITPTRILRFNPSNQDAP